MKRAGRVPAVTLVLLAANISAAFVLLVNPGIAETFGFKPNQPSLLDAVTSLFLHANVLHLLGNMIFLAAVGAAVELATGSIRFAIVYFVSGLAGVLAHYLATKSAIDPAPYIGASGAIAGCAAYYTIRYTTLRVPIAPHLAASVLAITAVWLGTQIAGAFIKIGDTGGVSYWAHMGGFAGGILLSLVFRAPDLGQIQMGHEVLERMNLRGPAAVAAAAVRHLEAHPDDLKALEELADAYHSMHEPAQEADILLRLLAVAPADDEVEILRRLAQTGLTSRLPLMKRLQLADRHRSDHPAIARALLRSVVEGPEDIQKPDAMLALVSLDFESDRDQAQETLRQLVETYPLHPAVEIARTRGWLA